MIKVNENTCIGCGACVAIAPENFDFSDAGLSKVISEEITETTKEAASACPVSAIEVTEVSATTETEESKVIEFPTQEVAETTEVEEETEIAA